MIEVSKQQLRPYFNEIHERATKVIEIVLIAYFVFGLFLSLFYDTWTVGVGVGVLTLALYYSSKLIFKGGRVHHYVISLALAIFMAQFIYQMHGLFEMHFTAFIAIIALMAYQNVWVFLPATLFIVIHHSIFAYIQYSGFINDNQEYKEIYFTQLDYMDLQTFIFHAGLVAVGVVIAAIYSEDMRKRTVKIATSLIDLQVKDERMELNVNFANHISQGEYDIQLELDEQDTMGKALLNMRDGLKESEKRESQERFNNQGLTQAATIIRNNANDLDQLSNEIISFLVKYLELNQGGIFVVDNDEESNVEVLALKGCYAYSRKKFLDKKIEISESQTSK